MAKKGVAKKLEPKKAVSKKPICFSAAAFLSMSEEERESAVVVLPLPEPLPGMMEKDLLAEIKLGSSNMYSMDEARVPELAALLRSGRGICGWSTFRAKTAEREPLSWKKWFDFCLKNFDAIPVVPSRPKKFSEAALRDEIEWLVAQNLVKVSGNLPGLIKKKSDKVEKPAKGRRSFLDLDDEELAAVSTPSDEGDALPVEVEPEPEDDTGGENEVSADD